MATTIEVVGVQYKDGTSLDGITISGTTYLFKNYNGITIGDITYRFTTWKDTDEEEVDDEPSGIYVGDIYIDDLDNELEKTTDAISAATASGAIPEEFYTDNDGTSAMNFIATDGSQVDVLVEHCICVLMPINELIVAEQYEAFNEAYFQDKLDEAEYAGDEEEGFIYKNIQLINQAIAKYYVDVANGDREPAYTLQEYLEVILEYTVEIGESIDAYFDAIQVNPDTGECEEPEIDFSSMELVAAETFEVAFTDVDNLLANGDNSYSLDNYKAYLVPNGLAEFHKAAYSDDQTTTGDCLIYTPTQLNVSETLKGFDWEQNTLYFVINDLNATIYLIQVTEGMVVDTLLTISVPCTGIGSFYSVPCGEEEELVE